MDTQRQTRDLRLDAVRGMFLVIMAGVHVPSPLSHYLQEPFGFTSAAEGFIFLSACLAGLAWYAREAIARQRSHSTRPPAAAGSGAPLG